LSNGQNNTAFALFSAAGRLRLQPGPSWRSSARGRVAGRRWWGAICVAVGWTALGSCGASSASEANLRAAVAEALPARYGCLVVNVPQAVAHSERPAVPDEIVASLLPSGLIEAREVTVVRWGFGWKQAPPGAIGSEPGTLYTLNAQAQPYGCQREVLFEGQRHGLRYGTPQLVEIVRYTTPTDTPLGRLTHVTFRYRLTHIPAWARDPAWQRVSVLPPEMRALEQIQEGTMTLILTNRGWRAQP